MTDGTEPVLTVTTPQASSGRAGWGVMAALAAGYIGIYLCRKNLAVAVPMLQRSFGATKAQIGIVASIGTLAYAAGKVINGPIVDRIGDRRGFLVSLAAVALFGAAGAFAPGLWALTLVFWCTVPVACWPALSRSRAAVPNRPRRPPGSSTVRPTWPARSRSQEPRSGGCSTSAGIRWASASSPASPACRP